MEKGDNPIFRGKIGTLCRLYERLKNHGAYSVQHLHQDGFFIYKMKIDSALRQPRFLSDVINTSTMESEREKQLFSCIQNRFPTGLSFNCLFSSCPSHQHLFENY